MGRKTPDFGHQVFPKERDRVILSQLELQELADISSVIDKPITKSAEKLVSKVCTELDLYEPDFTTTIHKSGEIVTLIARLIEWPFVQELKNIRMIDFVLMPLLFYLISLFIMFTFDIAEGFLIISILKEAVLAEESRFFERVAALKRRMYKFVLNGLDIYFSFVAGDAWISKVFFESLTLWANHQAPSCARFGFFFGDLFFVACNALAKIVFDIITADRYDVFANDEASQYTLKYTAAAILGFLPIIPRIISFWVITREIGLTGMRWKPFWDNKLQSLEAFFTGHVYDFLEVDDKYDVRLHDSYRGLNDVRIAFLLKSISKSELGVDIRLKQLALALMFESVPIRYGSRDDVYSPRSLRGASVFWFTSCYIADSAFFGRILPDHMSDMDAFGLSFLKTSEIEELDRKMVLQKEKNSGRTFPESVVCFMLAKGRLENSITLDYLIDMREQLANQIEKPRKSLDKIWMGLAIRDLYLYAENGGFMERYLATNFKELMGSNLEIILKNHLADSTPNLDKNGTNVTEKTGSIRNNSPEHLVVGGKMWDNARSNTTGHVLILDRKININLFTLYYFVRVPEKPSPGNYGDLIPINEILVSVFANNSLLKLIKPEIKEFVTMMAGRRQFMISWPDFYERTLKNQFRLFNGQFCVSSLVDDGTEDLPNGGLVLFWQTKLLESSQLDFSSILYLVCQVTTFYPEDKKEYLLCSEQVGNWYDSQLSNESEVRYETLRR